MFHTYNGCRGKLINVVSGVPQGSVWARYCSSYTPRSFFPIWRKSDRLCRWLHFDSYCAIPRRLSYSSTPWAVISSGLVSGVICGGWNWMRVRLRLWQSPGLQIVTMHPQSAALTMVELCWVESDDLVILGVTFDSKMTFEKHLHSVSRAAPQRFGIFRKSWQVFLW